MFLAFSQPATGPSSVCEGSDVTLQCVVVFISADNSTVTIQSNVWSRNVSGMITAITTQTPIPNHRVVFNSNTGTVTDLVITNVSLEDNNAVYICAIGATITSSVVLNVTGNNMDVVCVHIYCTYIATYISRNFSENFIYAYIYIASYMSILHNYIVAIASTATSTGKIFTFPEAGNVY